MISPLGAAVAPQALFAPGKGGPNELNEEQQAQVNRLRQRDAEVRRHEAAHATAGGPFAGAPSYKYVRGPDGRLYAVGGEVKIDVTPAGSPQATIAKMEQIIRAALAPADPSPQDRAIAAAAQQIKLRAEAEVRDQEAAETAERTRARDGNGETGTDLLQAAEAYGRSAGLVGGFGPSGSVFGAITA
jgi:hypothetical protein